MFGYVLINKPDMTFKEYDVYHGFYCGLCHALEKQFGLSSCLTLNYEMTFLALLLSGLYEPDTVTKKHSCLVHPFKKQTFYENEMIAYACKMTIVLAYYKCEDDWQDEKQMHALAYQKTLKKAFKKVKAEYPDKVAKIAKDLAMIQQHEKQKDCSFDQMASYFGEVLSEVFVYQDDIWADELATLGFYLGKFIYLLDAYEDIEKDLKKACFNPLQDMYGKVDFDDVVYGLLEMNIAAASMAFERLPIIAYVKILQNILYSGVWSKYELVRKKRMEGNKNDESI